MAKVGSLIIDIAANTTKLVAGMDRAENTVRRTTERIKRDLKALAAAYAGFQGVSVFRSMADEMTDSTNRLKLVTASTKELVAMQSKLFDVAQDTHAGLSGTIDLYADITRYSKELYTTEAQRLGITKAISEAMAISGASTQAADNATRQLMQGIASGVLRGEELNSILENSPRLAAAIAEGLGVSTGKLRALGKEGVLTSERVMMAISSQADKIDAEFSQMDVSMSRAFVNLRNQTLRTVAEMDQALGITNKISAAMLGISSHMGEIVSVAKAAASAFVLSGGIKYGIKYFEALDPAVTRTKKAMDLYMLSAAIAGEETSKFGALARVTATKIGSIASSLFMANAPLIALTAAFTAWNYVTGKSAEKQERLKNALKLTNDELAKMSRATRAVTLAEMNKSLIEARAKLHEYSMELRSTKRDFARGGIFGATKEELDAAQSAYDIQVSTVREIDAQVANLRKVSLEIDAGTYKSEEMGNSLYKAASGTDSVAAGAGNAASAIAAAANEAYRLASAISTAMAALGMTMRGFGVFRGEMNAKQAAVLNANANMQAAIKQGTIPSSVDNLKYRTPDRVKVAQGLAKYEKERLSISQKMQQWNIEGVKTAAEQLTIQSQIKRVDDEMTGVKTAQFDATQREVDIQRTLIADKAEYNAQYKNSAEYQKDLLALKLKEKTLSFDIAKAAQKSGGGGGGGGGKKAAKKAGKEEGTSYASAFSSAFDKIMHGDIFGAFSGLFNDIGKSLMKPFIDDWSKNLSDMIKPAFSGMSSLSSFGAGLGISLVGSLIGNIGSIFSNEVSQQEIDAAKGQTEFNDNSLKNAKELIDLNTEMGRHIKNMDKNFYAIAEAFSDQASAGGIDITGANFVETMDSGFLGFSSKQISLIGTGLIFGGGDTSGGILNGGTDLQGTMWFGSAGTQESIKSLSDELMTLGEAMDETKIGVQSYTTTLVKKSSFWGLFQSSSISETFSDVPQSIKEQFAYSFAEGYYSLLEAGVTLGMNRTDLERRLKSANLKFGEDGKIDFTGLSQEEISNRLSQVFSEALSGVADQAGFERLTDKYGTGVEQSYETVLRLADEFLYASRSLDSMGIQFGSAVDNYLDMVQGAGGKESFSSALSDYRKNFFTEEEQLQFKKNDLAKRFADLGLVMPETNEGFKTLFDSISDFETKGELLTLSGAFAEITESVSSSLNALKKHAGESLLDAFTAINPTNALTGRIAVEDWDGAVDAYDAAVKQIERESMTAVEAYRAQKKLNDQIEELKPDNTNEDILAEIKKLLESMETNNRLTEEINETLIHTA